MKKRLALLSAVLVISGMATACGQKTETAAPNENGSANTTEASAKTESAENGNSENESAGTENSGNENAGTESSAVQEPGSENSADNEEAIRTRNKETIHALLNSIESEEGFYAENGIRSLPFFPGGGAYWVGKEAIRNNSAANAEHFSGFAYDYIDIHETLDPNIYWVECGGKTDSADLSDDAKNTDTASATYETSYIDYFEFDDEGKILEYREYFSPLNLFPALGIDTPELEMPDYSVTKEEAYANKTETSSETTLENEEEARTKNKETIHALLNSIESEEGFYAENGIRSLPFFPGGGAYWVGKEAIRNNSAANAEHFSGFTYDYIDIHETLNPNIYWVECGGKTDSADLSDDAKNTDAASATYETFYIDYFEFDNEGKILEYREYFSPLNLFPALGIDTPELEMPDYSVTKEEAYKNTSSN